MVKQDSQVRSTEGDALGEDHGGTYATVRVPLINHDEVAGGEARLREILGGRGGLETQGG